MIHLQFFALGIITALLANLLFLFWYVLHLVTKKNEN